MTKLENNFLKYYQFYRKCLPCSALEADVEAVADLTASFLLAFGALERSVGNFFPVAAKSKFTL